MNATRVEKAFLHSGVITQPQEQQELLLQGVMQGGVSSFVPSMIVKPHLEGFLKNTFDMGEYDLCVLLDPSSSQSLSSVLTQSHASSARCRSVCVAFGPEGGWLPNELQLFKRFQQAHLGSNILRTDTAVIGGLTIVKNFFPLISTQLPPFELEPR